MSNNKKVALITGANKGIGYEIARAHGHNDTIVYVGARDAGRGAAAVDGLKEQGVEAILAQLDVTDETSIRAVRDLIRDSHGLLDILVNMPGSSTLMMARPAQSASTSSGVRSKPTSSAPFS